MPLNVTMPNEELSSSQFLVHYGPGLPVTLAGDASAYGIDHGAVISHTMPDGTEHPIASVSRECPSFSLAFIACLKV